VAEALGLQSAFSVITGSTPYIFQSTLSVLPKKYTEDVSHVQLLGFYEKRFRDSVLYKQVFPAKI
jgi:hypothetical protein